MHERRHTTPHLRYDGMIVNYSLICSTGRRLRLRVPIIDDAELPIFESVAELNDLRDAPHIDMQILTDDGGDAYPTLEEMLEGVLYLEERELIPCALAAELRAVIVETAE